MDDLAALVGRTEGVQPGRRLFHAATGLTLAFLPAAAGMSRVLTVSLLAAATLLLATMDLVRLRRPAANALFFRVFRIVASPREEARTASSTWYALGGLLVYLLYPRPVAAGALVVLALADPAASVVGRLWGSVRLGGGTVRGSLTFFAVAAMALWPLVGAPAAAAAAAITTVAEVLPLRLDDNLVVPLVCGAALWWLAPLWT